MGREPEGPSLSAAGAADVLVLGDGPAGCATAIALAGSGRSVLMLGPGAGGPEKVGESLPPGAAGLVRRLGAWDAFLADGHRPCYGNKSAWGSPALRFHDFITDPRGHGWHIDRARFERMLADRAGRLGVRRVSAGPPKRLRRTRGGWRLEAAGLPAPLSARFVVDATGRASWFARRQGVERRAGDRQVALVALLSPRGRAAEDAATLVEAVEGGWWYSAVLPDGRLSTVFMTDPDLWPLGWMRGEQGWRALLGETQHTRGRVLGRGYALASPPRLVAASGGRLTRFAGEGWLAVGDAAMAYDPLASHGLTMALQTGVDAAAAVSAALGGDAAGLGSYCARLEHAYETYAALRLGFYRAERRWPGSPYWRRRATGGPTGRAGR